MRKGRVTTMEDIDPLNKYRPTAVPFVNPVEKYEKEQQEKREAKKIKKDVLDVVPGLGPMKMEIDDSKGKEKMEEGYEDEDGELAGGAAEVPAETQKKNKTAAEFFMKEEMVLSLSITHNKIYRQRIVLSFFNCLHPYQLHWRRWGRL